MGGLIQLVPSLPPPAEGVGSYALALAEALAAHHGLGSRFVVGDPAWKAEADAAFPAAAVAARTPEALEQALAQSPAAAGGPVLLHYANYGYEPRGCPGWLVEGLRRWLAAGRERRLVTFFHEVHASGPPWTSAFWLRSRQRRLAAAVARASVSTLTSLELYAGLLRSWTERPPALLPVFSTVGEPESVAPWEARQPRLVVFGGRGAREAAYGPLASELELACRRLGIEEICDIGPPISTVPSRVGPAAVSSLGLLPGAEVGALLRSARAGYLAYPAYFLPKSTIFAAYAAHGLLPVRGWPKARERPPGELLPNVHFWEPLADQAGSLGGIAAAARDWYLGHRLEVQAGTFARLLSPWRLAP